jgi:hypothetical protein
MARYDIQGSLDLLVLKTLSLRGSLHGYGIVPHKLMEQRIQAIYQALPATRDQAVLEAGRRITRGFVALVPVRSRSCSASGSIRRECQAGRNKSG